MDMEGRVAMQEEMEILLQKIKILDFYEGLDDFLEDLDDIEFDSNEDFEEYEFFGDLVE